MNYTTAIETVRDCLAAIKPGVDLTEISADLPLLEERVITSFDVLDLILHLERISGAPINRAQLVAGSFRDMATIARVFLGAEADS